MHSFASNFKNFTNQNLHFFTPLRPPPLGGTAALFLPFIFLALLQTPNLKPQCILLHLTSRILQIRTHIFCHTTQGPPGGHCCNLFPAFFGLVCKHQTLKPNAFFFIELQEFYKSEPTFFFTPQRAPGGVGMLTLFPSYFLAAVQTLNFKLQ